MISKFDAIQGMFEEIASKLVDPINVYVIGGAALMHYGSKEATKDIDLVLSTKNEYELIRQVLKDLGFSSKTAPMTHQNFTLADWLTRDDFRIDLFNETICGKLKLTGRIVQRAKKLETINNLHVYVCSKEDIFVFKSITEREGDKDDCMALIKQGINWEIIFEELNQQIKETGYDIWITIVNERLEELSESGLTIPILKQTQALTEIYYQKLDEKQKVNSQ